MKRKTKDDRLLEEAKRQAKQFGLRVEQSDFSPPNSGMFMLTGYSPNKWRESRGLPERRMSIMSGTLAQIIELCGRFEAAHFNALREFVAARNDKEKANGLFEVVKVQLEKPETPLQFVKVEHHEVENPN
jgi:hypothetical protein